MADSPFPVFDATGTMLGNQTSDWGTIPNSLPALPPIPGLASTPAGVKSAGGTATGGTVAATGAAQGTSGTPSNAQPSASGVPSGVADYFLRGVIVVLGFIFVAVGLRMFGVPIPGPGPGRK